MMGSWKPGPLSQSCLKACRKSLPTIRSRYGSSTHSVSQARSRRVNVRRYTRVPREMTTPSSGRRMSAGTPSGGSSTPITFPKSSSIGPHRSSNGFASLALAASGRGREPPVPRRTSERNFELDRRVANRHLVRRDWLDAELRRIDQKQRCIPGQWRIYERQPEHARERHGPASAQRHLTDDAAEGHVVEEHRREVYPSRKVAAADHELRAVYPIVALHDDGERSPEAAEARRQADGVRA